MVDLTVAGNPENALGVAVTTSRLLPNWHNRNSRGIKVRNYLNNVVEQDHRTVKKRVRLAKGYGSFQSAWRTLQGIETMHMINKGRVRWLPIGDAVGQAYFIAEPFGIAA